MENETFKFIERLRKDAYILRRSLQRNENVKSSLIKQQNDIINKIGFYTLKHITTNDFDAKYLTSLFKEYEDLDYSLNYYAEKWFITNKALEKVLRQLKDYNVKLCTR